MYCIIKMIENQNGVELPVILLDNADEVWEFETQSEAEKMSEILTKNSDSGYEYFVKKL
jgi:hypothetical protein